MKKKSFRKEERLCHKRSIDDLFHKGSSFLLYPFRIVYVRPNADPVVTDPAVRVLISVPKRRIRKASERNLLKRRIREAYRLQKQELLVDFAAGQNASIDFAIQYLPSEILDYSLLSDKLALALDRLCKEYAALYLGENN